MQAMYDIALMAQKSKIRELVSLVRKYHNGIAKQSVVATLDTGLAIKSMTGIDIELLSCGFEGGYFQLAGLVNTGNLRMVIFLHNPQLSLEDPGILELLRSCNVRNIPFANNMTTAEFILHRFLEKEMSNCWRRPDSRPDGNLIYA